MAQTKERFQHQRLDITERLQVRLVTIQAGLFSSPIQCSIDFALLDPIGHVHDSAPVTNTHARSAGSQQIEIENCRSPYEALSYTWGEATVGNDISLSGKSFNVSTNLYGALRHLRYEDRPRVLWVDAICLDQADEIEKRHQIPIMHLIYAQATRVVVWLGSESEDSEIAMQYIQYLHSTVEPGKEDEISDTNHFTNWPISLMSRAPLSTGQINSSLALYRLLSRPWFRRAWIVQEIAFANDPIIICGSSSVTWIQLRIAMHMARINHVLLMAFTDIADRGQVADGDTKRTWPAQTINNALSLLYDRERVRRERPEQTDDLVTELSWCLGINKARLCRFPQDRIYSVLGIAGRKFREQVRTDYILPAEEHYREVVRYFFDATGSLDVILHAQHAAWLVSGSSWAPDWGLPERAAILHQNQQGLANSIPVTDNTDVDFVPNSRLLRIKGCFLGTVKFVRLEFEQLLNLDQPFFDMSQAYDTKTNLPPRQRTWWEFRAEHSVGQLFGHCVSHVPATSPLWKRHLELFLQVLATRWYPDALKFVEKDCTPSEDFQELEEKDRFTELEDFWNLMVYLLSSRTICKTETGRLVLAPDFTQSGDNLVLLAGCSSSVILRKQGDGSCKLLGDAYALGLSMGEVTKDELSEVLLS